MRGWQLPSVDASPYTRARIFSGPFFLPEIPAPRGVPAISAAGADPPTGPESATFSPKSCLYSPFGLRVGADGGQAKSTTYACRFIVNHGGRSHLGLDDVCHLY